MSAIEEKEQYQKSSEASRVLLLLLVDIHLSSIIYR